MGFRERGGLSGAAAMASYCYWRCTERERLPAREVKILYPIGCNGRLGRYDFPFPMGGRDHV